MAHGSSSNQNMPSEYHYFFRKTVLLSDSAFHFEHNPIDPVMIDLAKHT